MIKYTCDMCFDPILVDKWGFKQHHTYNVWSNNFGNINGLSTLTFEMANDIEDVCERCMVEAIQKWAKEKVEEMYKEK